jgi:hypothetical protein
MGFRKKMNAINKRLKAKAKIKRDKKKLKKAAKPATAGEKLHAKMYGKSESK